VTKCQGQFNFTVHTAQRCARASSHKVHFFALVMFTSLKHIAVALHWHFIRHFCSLLLLLFLSSTSTEPQA